MESTPTKKPTKARKSDSAPIAAMPPTQEPEGPVSPLEASPLADINKPQPSSQKVQDRLVIPLRPDGKPDWDTMRESTKQRVRVALGEQAGPVAPSMELKPVIPVLWSSIAMLGGFLLSAGLPDEGRVLVMRQMALSQQELEALEGPTVAILQKYMPNLGGWEAEVTFLLAVGSIFGPKVAGTVAMKKQVKATLGQRSAEPEGRENA